MNFKHMALMLLLLPVVSYGNEIESRIKELKEAQVAKSKELIEVLAMVEERSADYWHWRDMIAKYHKSRTEEDVDQLYIEFTKHFYSGNRIEQFIAGINKKTKITVLVYIMRGIVLQFLYQETILRYDTLVNDLTAINLKVAALKEGKVHAIN
ncbi:MAG TPA: hypothetical protein VGT41_02245 [Candidatus Babeliales bacterium]|nr:hypothetical protein [Candidatus Babeliales bacterium]